MISHNRRVLVGMVALALPCVAQAQRATLAIDPPVVRGGLKIGNNVVTTNVYNEQQLPTPLQRREGVALTLVVSQPDGAERTYSTRTARNSRFPGGQPHQKVRASFSGVEAPAAGEYILTVRVEPDDNPIEYSVSSGRGSASSTFSVGGGGRGAPVGGASGTGNEFTAKLVWNGRPGGGLRVKLLSAEGTLLKEKRATGDGKASFANLPPGSYKLRVLRANQELDAFDVEMPAGSYAETYQVR